MLLRSKATTVLDLTNKGLTDQLGLLIAESLSNNNLPAVTSFILAGNDQLTEASVTSIIAAVVSNSTITNLDLSNLKVLNSVANKNNMKMLQPLLTYLAKRYCPLKVLRLGGCDLFDQ